MKLTFTTSSEGQAVLAGATVTVWHWASCPLPGGMLLINGPEEDDCTRESEVWEASLRGPAQRECPVNHHRCFHVTFFFSDWQSCCSCAKTGCSAFGRLRVTCSQSWGCAGCRGLRALTCMAKRKPKGRVLTQVGRLVPRALWLPCLSLRKAKGIISPCCAATVSVVRGWGGFTKSPGKDRTSLLPPAPFQPLPSPGYLDLPRIRLCVQ